MFAALVDVTGNWLSVVVLLGTILGALWRVWAKAFKPRLDALAEQSSWVRTQIEANGIARSLGTHNDTLRDALDRNTADTKAVAEALESVRIENVRALAEVAEIERAHHQENQAAIRNMREGQ